MHHDKMSHTATDSHEESHTIWATLKRLVANRITVNSQLTVGTL